MSLDHDLLKRTEGLLGDIDTAVSSARTANAVSRVLESACTTITHATFDTVEEWEDHRRDHRLTRVDHCGCWNDECADTYEKDEPISFQRGRSPFVHGNTGGGVAPHVCGVPGCACVELLPPRKESGEQEVVYYKLNVHTRSTSDRMAHLVAMRGALAIPEATRFSDITGV